MSNRFIIAIEVPIYVRSSKKQHLWIVRYDAINFLQKSIKQF